VNNENLLRANELHIVVSSAVDSPTVLIKLDDKREREPFLVPLTHVSHA
jgi:hypothetical protein